MVYGSWFMVDGSGFMVHGIWFSVFGSGFRNQDSGFRIQCSRFRVAWLSCQLLYARDSFLLSFVCQHRAVDDIFRVLGSKYLV
jgi:hypothetical protein